MAAPRRAPLRVQNSCSHPAPSLFLSAFCHTSLRVSLPLPAVPDDPTRSNARLHTMVSPLWKACSEGNLEIIVELLKETSPVDIEVKGELLPLGSEFSARVRVRDLRIHLTRLVTRSYRRYSPHRGCEERTRRGRTYTARQGYVAGL